MEPKTAQQQTDQVKGSVAPARADADPYKWTSIGVTFIFALTIPLVLVVIVLAQPEPERSQWHFVASELGVAPYRITAGDLTYHDSCEVCHGPNGDGVHGLGKPLRNSAYVQEHSDEQIFRLIVEGRKTDDPENTTGALMPQRGAQGLSDRSIRNVVLYLRAIQDPSATLASTEPWDIKSREGEVGGTSLELTDHPGYDLYVASCAACHGQGAEGIEGQGLPLVTSGFVRGTSDQELIKFIKRGRPMWDANNTTGLDMPPKGGNPAITQEQLQAIVDYLRALQQEAMGS